MRQHGTQFHGFEIDFGSFRLKQNASFRKRGPAAFVCEFVIYIITDRVSYRRQLEVRVAIAGHILPRAFAEPALVFGFAFYGQTCVAHEDVTCPALDSVAKVDTA